MTAPTRATIVAPWSAAADGALVRWTATDTTLRDAGGRETVLRHGTDVDALALRRTPTGDRGASWTLDLMLGDTCRARLQAPPWDFDRDHGPSQAAAVSGLPLDHRPARLATEPAPVDPAARPSWAPGTFALALLGVAGVLTLLVASPLRDSAWFIAVVGALPLPFLVVTRWPRRRSRHVVYRPRPSVPVPREFLRRGGIVRGDDVLTIRTGGRSMSVPLPDDACGPRLLQRVGSSEDGSGACESVELRSADGRTLVRLLRREWCPGDTDRDLAAALGLAHGRQVVPPGVTGFGARAEGARKGDNLHTVIASLPGALGLAFAQSLPGDGAATTVALALTGLGLVLGLLGEIIGIVATSRGRALVAPPSNDRSTP